MKNEVKAATDGLTVKGYTKLQYKLRGLSYWLLMDGKILEAIISLDKSIEVAKLDEDKDYNDYKMRNIINRISSNKLDD